MDKKFTPEEIAKSLRVCTTRPSVPYIPCEGCILRDNPLAERYYEINSIAADLIEAQAKRIAELEEQLRWIPVGERKPETVHCDAGTEYSEAVSVLTSGRKVLTAIWDGSEWLCDRKYREAWDEEITHWRSTLPLPKGPEGCHD